MTDETSSTGIWERELVTKLATAIRDTGDHLVDFHVADNNRMPPGQGRSGGTRRDRAGADRVAGYAGVTPDNVGPLVDGTIFTRGGKNKQNTAIFVVFILVVILRPQGLFGRSTERT